MTVKEFLEAYNFAPYELSEIAELVSAISDDVDAANTARYFLEAKENLELVLVDMGFESG